MGGLNALVLNMCISRRTRVANLDSMTNDVANKIIEPGRVFLLIAYQIVWLAALSEKG